MAAPESIYDHELALRLAGQQPDLAADMLAGLLRTLPETVAEIKNAAEQRDFITLKKTVHKLHGLICYCGVPRLNNAIKALETALKQNELSAECFQALYDEAAALQAAF